MQLPAVAATLSLVFIVGGRANAAAIPEAQPQGVCEPTILCVDGINTCGVRFGGCYDICDAKAKPSPPPCPKTTTTTLTVPTKGVPTTITTSTVPTATVDAECAKRTVCADYVNSCGMMYGGCFADCRPWPTFAPPPCPTAKSTSTSTTVKAATTSSSSSSSKSRRTRWTRSTSYVMALPTPHHG
ncbi:hypothetical protein B0H63DRAFT_554977 [Podospora didyma]|uniref:Uncharacterized protein n=1 Tax=Podospora didyma TaxID=330526 RepID=A0AAE0U7E6_9PEZI|nr:hypothetical protein B0H63DRAFT_554977 [Podospora didyma]